MSYKEAKKLHKLLDEIKACNYQCEAGPLTLNRDWVELYSHVVGVVVMKETLDRLLHAPPSG